jgi:hypothetical protein
MLGRSLRLILTVQDLVTTNKQLRANWDGRKESILALVKNLVSTKLGQLELRQQRLKAEVAIDNIDHSEPRSLCRELALSVIQELPDALVGEKTLPEVRFQTFLRSYADTV